MKSTLSSYPLNTLKNRAFSLSKNKKLLTKSRKELVVVEEKRGLLKRKTLRKAINIVDRENNPAFVCFYV